MGSFSARLKAVPFPVNIKIQLNTKVKGDGQECPSHTSKIKSNFGGIPRPVSDLIPGSVPPRLP